MWDELSGLAEWGIKWGLAAVAMPIYWNSMVTEMRRNRQIPARIVLVFLFSMLQLLETGFFIRVLQDEEFHTFGFTFSLLIPTVIFWVNLAAFFVGVARAIRGSVGIGRFNPIRGFRLFQWFHWCLPISELAFALAYGSKIGLGMFAIRCAEVGYQNYLIWPRPKRRSRPDRQRKYA